MANITINDATLAELTAGQLAADDLIPVWDTSAAATKKVSRAALVGATIVGDGKTLTVPANGTVSVLEAANVYTQIQTMPSARSGGPTSMLDDTAIAIPIPSTAIVVLTAGLSALASGIVICRCTGAVFCSILGSAPGTALVATTGTVLTGVTGADGKMTVSAHTNGNLYVENRTGQPFSLSWFLMAVV